MTEGAFAFLDCLGFKGVWNRGVSPKEIISFLKDAKNHARNSPTFAANETSTNIELSTIFLSDSVAISARFKSPPKLPEVAAGYVLMFAVLLSVELCKRFSRGPVPLALRGSITYGPHLAEDSFILGPAVDEAATLAESTQGAFIWLTPKAQVLYRKHFEYERTIGLENASKRPASQAVTGLERVVDHQEKFGSQTNMPNEVAKNLSWWRKLTPEMKLAVAPDIVRAVASHRRGSVVMNYPMEMKSGGYLCADVVNPLLTVSPERHDDWIRHLMSGFSDAPIDVLMKKQNTLRFLSVASQQAKKTISEELARQESIRTKLEEVTGVSF